MKLAISHVVLTIGLWTKLDDVTIKIEHSSSTFTCIVYVSRGFKFGIFRRKPTCVTIQIKQN